MPPRVRVSNFRVAFDETTADTTFIARRRDSSLDRARQYIFIVMPSSRGSLEELERLLQRVTRDAAFERRFAELSRSGDRLGMIGALLRPELEALQVQPCFRGKDEARARQLLEGDSPQPDAALFAAPAGSSLFFEALAKRARASCERGELRRCEADCRYFLQVAKDGLAHLEGRVDVLLMLAECLKSRAATHDAKNCMNEAMRWIGELARSRCGQGENSQAFRAEKAEILRRFLIGKTQISMPDADCVAKREATSAQVDKSIPAINGRPNEFLSSCSDSVAVGYDNTKGRLLYATKNIKAGSVVIVDRPFSCSTDVAALQRNCLNCHASLRLDDSIKVPCESCQTVNFCSEICRREGWDKFHKYECRIFDYFYENKFQRTNSSLAYRTVIIGALKAHNDSIEINQEFIDLHEGRKVIPDIKSLEKYEPQDYQTVFNLESNSSHCDPKENLEKSIHAIFFAICLIYSLKYFHSNVDNFERRLHVLAVALLHSMQVINCNAYEIVENIRDDKTKILEPRNVGGAIYTSVSLTNHSCYPNIVRHSFPCGIVVVSAIRFIPQGSEVLDCYGQHFLENDRDSRRKLLAQKYYFKCQCEACSFDWPSVMSSDQFNFKCKKCFKQCRRTSSAAECTACGQRTEINKLYASLQNSIKKRLAALTKMYDGYYKDALPLLLEHSNCIEKILSEPSLEAVKTQQSIIQCLNAMSSNSI